MRREKPGSRVHRFATPFKDDCCNATFSYSANGGTTQVVNGSTTWRYEYDPADGLLNVTRNSQLVQVNVYSSNGDRVEQTYGNRSVVYAYTAIQIVFEKNLTSGATTDHFYANGLQLAKLVSGTTAYYLVDDALGSTRLVTDLPGTTLFSSNYQPYGQGYARSGAKAFTYTGKLLDSLTGLYYFGARFYGYAVGRFISEGTERWNFDPAFPGFPSASPDAIAFCHNAISFETSKHTNGLDSARSLHSKL